MSALPFAVVLVPLLGAVLAALVGPGAAGWIGVGASALAFVLAAALPWAETAVSPLLADPLAVHMALLVAFVGMTGAWTARVLPRGHALFLALLAALLLGVLADDTRLAWAGAAASVFLLVLALRPAPAARGLLLAGGAGLGLALLGTLLLGATAPGWTALTAAAPGAHAPLLSLAFVFLLLGYGTLAGLVPLHGGVPAALAEGPVPITGVLGALLPTLALTLLLRARAVLAANPAAMPPGPPLLALGLLSLLLAALALRRQEGARFLATVGTAQAGVVAFAWGLGDGAATFAGVLHLTLFTLLRTALAQTYGRLPDGASSPAFALTLGAGLVALAGVPPFGLFTSFFLILLSAARQAPVLAVLLGIGLAASGWALVARLPAFRREAPADADAEADAPGAPPPAALIPAWLHLAVVLLLGLAMPAGAVGWLARIAEALR